MSFWLPLTAVFLAFFAFCALDAFFWLRITGAEEGSEWDISRPLRRLVAAVGYYSSALSVGALVLTGLIYPALFPAASISRIQQQSAPQPSVPCHVGAVVMPAGQPSHTIYSPPGCGPE